MAKRRVRVGVVGCGLVAQVMHLHYLRELRERFEIAAICDLSPTVLEHVGQEYGVARRFTDWRQLLAEPLDAVMVLTSGSHAPIAIAAAEAHRHVFIEKPIAFSEAEGREIIEAGRKAGVHLMVGYMKRYDPAVERLREELPAWTDIRSVITTTLESPYRPYVSHYPLVTGTDVDPAAIGSLQADDDQRIGRAISTKDPLVRRVYRRFLLDSLVHDLNLVRGLLGEPDGLEYARLTEDGVVAIFTLGKVPWTVHWVNLINGMARYRQEFAFYSPSRRATLVFPSPFLRSMPTQVRLESGVTDGPLARQTVETVSYDEAFKRELVEFHECITADREPRTTAADGVRDVALCQALVTAHLNSTGMALPAT